MSATQRLLVLVEPAVLDGVARYVEQPRKRESIALALAAREPGADPARTVQRATGIAARLDGIVRAREDGAGNYSRRLWSEVALLAASNGPSWGEGVGRSLALLAHPERFTGAPPPASVRHLSRAARYLLRSTAELVPELSAESDALPPWGGEGLASGVVPHDFTEWLSLLLSGDEWPLAPLARELFGARSAEIWRDNARRAARAAARTGSHLLEVDLSTLRAQRSGPPSRPESFVLQARVA